MQGLYKGFGLVQELKKKTPISTYGGTMKNNIVRELTQSLKNFGLNPTDWVVFKVGAQTFAVLSKEGPQLLLAGPIQRTEDSWNWAHLEYVEI